MPGEVSPPNDAELEFGRWLFAQDCRFTTAAVSLAQLPAMELAEVAFAGRSNVGKSSLLNRLLGRKKLAHTSSTPGRTRGLNYYLINERFYFVDLPGYGYAKVSKQERRAWARLLESYLRRASGTAKVVQLVDGKVGATPLDVQAVEYLESLGIAPIVVATKIDRVPSSRRAAAMRNLRTDLDLDPEDRVIAFSARSGEGVRELWREIEDYLDPSKTGNEDTR